MSREVIEGFDSKVQRVLPKEEESDTVPDVKFPFKNCRDETGKKLNVILISAPFRTPEDEQTYISLRKQGLQFCGVSSYSNFPGHIDNPFEDRFHEQKGHDYLKMVTSWLHCFRDEKIPGNLRSAPMPKMLLSEADLKDCDGYYKPDPSIKKEYDFMYICLDDSDVPEKSTCEPGWQSHNRNWDLAKKCLSEMCEKYHLKGYIVGRTNCEFPESCSASLKQEPFMEFHTFQKEMQKCKWLFVPNISDASPRVMTEAMCYNMPVLVNYDIIGGWHNVIPGITGEFFHDEKDLHVGLDKLLKNYDSYHAREWYCHNRGRQNSGKKLAEFMKHVYGSLLNVTNPLMIDI